MEQYDYQVEAFDACRDGLRTLSRVLVVAPTGSGKSVMIAHIVKACLDKGTYVTILTHSAELVNQNYQTFIGWFPEYEGKSGMFSASLGDDYTQPAMFSTIQTAAKRIQDDKYKHPLSQRRDSLIIIDEAHRVNRDSQQYGSYIKFVEQANPKVKFIGYTATPHRQDQGPIVGDDKFFQKEVYSVDMKGLVDNEFLVEPITQWHGDGADRNLLEKTSFNNDYTETSQERAITAGGGLENIIKDALKQGKGRKKWLWFLPSKRMCYEANKILQDLGLKSEAITSSTPKTKRKDIISQYKDSELNHLCNVQVLTTGFDVPDIDCIPLLRATSSTVMYVQIVGRGVRKAFNKLNCLFLDYMENIKEHGFIDKPNYSEGDNRVSKNRQYQPKTIKCLGCGVFNPTTREDCKNCGEDLPIECKHCQTLNPSTSTVCSSCDKSLLAVFSDDVQAGSGAMVSWQTPYKEIPWDVEPHWVKPETIKWTYNAYRNSKHHDYTHTLTCTFEFQGHKFRNRFQPFKGDDGFSWYWFDGRLNDMGLGHWKRQKLRPKDLTKWLNDNSKLPDQIRVQKKTDHYGEVLGVKYVNKWDDDE